MQSVTIKINHVGLTPEYISYHIQVSIFLEILYFLDNAIDAIDTEHPNTIANVNVLTITKTMREDKAANSNRDSKHE